MKKFIKSDLAVSEAIGFIQTLAIVIISTAIVFYAGAPMLEKAQKNAHFMEMEKGFILLSGNLEKVGFDRAPIRNTELNIMGGAMVVAHDSNISIGISSFPLGSIEYRYDDKVIAYENGGIWIKHPGGEVTIVSRPRFSTGNLSTIPVMQLLGDYWVAGEGGIKINSVISSSRLYPIDGENGTVEVKVNSSYYKGWKEYLESIGATIVNVDDAGTTVTANFSADIINVDHNKIDIKVLEE